MKPIDIILILVVVVILVIAIRRFVGTATGTRDCCSGAKKSLGKQFRARTIDDKDESRYPYQADLEIGGMSCEHCVERHPRARFCRWYLGHGLAYRRPTRTCAQSPPSTRTRTARSSRRAGYRLVGVNET